ncbi:MAG: hypothetical protein QNL62_03350 [Gammaproteobacteria bacterium]|nr:hypothetical protein [Gammaproteobacteria bacterium]
MKNNVIGIGIGIGIGSQQALKTLFFTSLNGYFIQYYHFSHFGIISLIYPKMDYIMGCTHWAIGLDKLQRVSF